ncbi:MAG: acyltransferase family protein [Cephaloticoccus sp.]|nr:acyltransferase family protein [Cephaloticoccus sp.]MCF7761686.1 acyltransferase family protein [Cephaloticoccus sp.]
MTNPIAAGLPSPGSIRLDHLDATRAFALVLGVVFHASLSFLPTYIGWAVQDVSTGELVAPFISVSHAFRLEVFFLLAGYFSHLTFHRRGAQDFVRTRAWRVVLPFVLGWFLLRPLLVSGWAMGFASMRGDANVWTGLVAGMDSFKALPAGLFTGTHLWFLYYLALITVLTLAGRALLMSLGGRRVDHWARGVDAGVGWLARSIWALPVLVLPTAWVLWRMQTWGMDTPDQSLRPHGPVLLIYGGFFCFGWLLERQPAAMTALARLAPARWIGAAVGLAGVLMLGGLQMDPGHPGYVAGHRAFVVSYALLMWSLVFLSIGLCRSFCQRPRPWVRYVADSSYWMYLIHLPVVIWLQVAVAEVPVHWTFKLPCISAVTIALSLLSYDLFVRSTFIGAILNGRHRDQILWPWLRGKFRQLALAGENPMRETKVQMHDVTAVRPNL